MTCAELIHRLKEWQDLFSGVLAFSAGAATVYFLWRQIKAERDRHHEAIYRKSLSARAQMPDALSELSEFTGECYAWLVDETKPLPTRPSAAIETLKSGIEYADNKTALAVFELVSFYQVHNARAFGGRNPRIPAELPERLYDTTRLRAQVNQLFPYARNMEQVIGSSEISLEQMMSAFRTGTGLEFETQFPEIYDGLIERLGQRHH